MIWNALNARPPSYLSRNLNFQAWFSPLLSSSSLFSLYSSQERFFLLFFSSFLAFFLTNFPALLSLLPTSLSLKYSSSPHFPLPKNKTRPTLFSFSHKHTLFCSDFCLKNQLSMSKIKEVMVWSPNLNSKIRLHLIQFVSSW